MFPVAVLLMIGGYWLLYDGVQRVEKRSDWGPFAGLVSLGKGAGTVASDVNKVTSGNLGKSAENAAGAVLGGPVGWWATR